MMKPWQVLALTAHGKLLSKHLGQDRATAISVYIPIARGTGEGLSEVALTGPYGIERRRKFGHVAIPQPEIAPRHAETKPAEAVQV